MLETSTLQTALYQAWLARPTLECRLRLNPKNLAVTLTLEQVWFRLARQRFDRLKLRRLNFHRVAARGFHARSSCCRRVSELGSQPNLIRAAVKLAATRELGRAH